MPRAYLDKYGRYPLFTNERGVGVNMANDRKDVMLVQLLLKAILYSNKAFLGNDVVFMPPSGPELAVSGSWDQPSREYLKRWEDTLAKSRGYWAYGKEPATQFPGTVVPYIQGGRKIRTMAEMCVMMFGADRYATLDLPNVTVPQEVADDLFIRRI